MTNMALQLKDQPPFGNHITVDLVGQVCSHSTTAVELRLIVNGQAHRCFGEARRDPHDRHDPEAALALALSRAFASVTRKFERLANGKVKHNDHTKAQLVAQKAARRMALQPAPAVQPDDLAERRQAAARKAAATRKRNARKKAAPVRKVAKKKAAARRR